MTRFPFNCSNDQIPDMNQFVSTDKYRQPNVTWNVNGVQVNKGKAITHRQALSRLCFRCHIGHFHEIQYCLFLCTCPVAINKKNTKIPILDHHLQLKKIASHFGKGVKWSLFFLKISSCHHQIFSVLIKSHLPNIQLFCLFVRFETRHVCRLTTCHISSSLTTSFQTVVLYYYYYHLSTNSLVIIIILSCLCYCCILCIYVLIYILLY